MNWIKQNTFLSGLIALLVIGLGGLGFFFTKARGEFADAQDRLAAAYKSKRDLQEQKPFPSSENAAVVRDLVSDYRTKAEAVANKMYVGQVPMPTGVRVAQFQEDLALKVDAVVEASSASGVTLPEGFYLGLDKYRAQVPLEGAVDQLQFQLNATVWLSNLLLANDVKRFSVKREQMPFETREQAPAPRARGQSNSRGNAKPKPKAEPVSVTYPMEIAIELPEKNFQSVLNALSNTSSALGEAADEGEFYFVTRWMRLENQSLIGPERSDAPDDIELEEGEEPAAEQESQGINMVFGRENVRAYLALDLVRFLPKVPNE
ncbi:MAG: hypothetical protein GWQ05_19330 [Verrucomicrobiaceae bacterium]|nr:hypothetical protein [Verrucomicrobiaceae bacterium]NCF93081.1 hypothetical protein [Verrucomicrobiaceae bacterium]